MSTSSQLPNYSVDLSEYTITIAAPSDSDTVYIDTSNMNSYVSSIGIGAVGSITLPDTITFNDEFKFNWGDSKEWVDAFPDWQRAQDMCKAYPALEIALRNFQTVYQLVKDDYDNPAPKK